MWDFSCSQLFFSYFFSSNSLNFKKKFCHYFLKCYNYLLKRFIHNFCYWVLWQLEFFCLIIIFTELAQVSERFLVYFLCLPVITQVWKKMCSKKKIGLTPSPHLRAKSKNNTFWWHWNFLWKIVFLILTYEHNFYIKANDLFSKYIFLNNRNPL